MYTQEINLAEYGKTFNYINGGKLATVSGGATIVFKTKKASAPIKGYLKNLDSGEYRAFQFNPTPPFTYSRGVTYATIESPGQAYPITSFVKGNIRTFNVDLFLFDKPYTGVIDKDYMLFLGKLLTPEENVPEYTRPPKFIFSFGYFTRTCVLDDLNISIEEYDKYLNPVRATMGLTIRQEGV